jgi:hypothetical protein
MKRATALLILLSAATVATAAPPPIVFDLEANYQQTQTLGDIELVQGANASLQFRLRSRGRWLDLTGLTARFDARSSATSTQAVQVVSSSTVTNTTPNYFQINLTDTATGSAVTNWVWSLVVLSGTDEYPIGYGSFGIPESTWTGASAILSNVTAAAYTDAATNALYTLLSAEIDSDVAAAAVAGSNYTDAVGLSTGTASTNYTDAAAVAATNYTDNLTVVCGAGYRSDVYWYLTVNDVFTSYTTNSVVTNQDVIVYNLTSGVGFTDKQLFVQFVRGNPDTNDLVWVSSSAGVATVANGFASMVTAGDARISAILDGITKFLDLQFCYSAPGQTVTDWLGGDTNTVRLACETNIDSRISGGGSSGYWSTVDHVSTNYVRDPTCWAADADLSGVAVHTGWGADPNKSPYNYNTRWHGTLIAPNIIMLPKHCMADVPNQVAAHGEPVGAIKRFVGQDGTIYHRTVTAHLDPYPAQANWSSSQDIMLGVLDSDLPTNNVAVYKILPADYADYIPNGMTEIPALLYNQHGDCTVSDFASISSMVQPTDATRLSYFYLPYAGDSGRPVFLWADDGLVLMFTLTYPLTGPTNPRTHYDAIQTALTPYGVELTVADWTTYRSF